MQHIGTGISQKRRRKSGDLASPLGTFYHSGGMEYEVQNVSRTFVKNLYKVIDSSEKAFFVRMFMNFLG